MTALVILAIVGLAVIAGLVGRRLLIRSVERERAERAVARPPFPRELVSSRPAAPRPTRAIVKTHLDGLSPVALCDLAAEAKQAAAFLASPQSGGCQCRTCLPELQREAVELRRFAKECRRRADFAPKVER